MIDTQNCPLSGLNVVIPIKITLFRRGLSLDLTKLADTFVSHGICFDLMPDKLTFDAWTLVFLVAAIQGYFIALMLLVWKRGRSQTNRLLAGLLLLFALTMSEYVLYWSHAISRYPHIAHLSTQLPFLFGPVMWLYLRGIYEKKALSAADWLHAVPFALAVMAFAPWYGLSAAEKSGFLINGGQFPVAIGLARAIMWLRNAHLLAYAAWNFYYIRRQPVVGATTRWALLLNGFYAGFALAYLSYFILIRFPFFNSSWDYHISATMTAFIYLIAYAGYVQPAIFDGFDWTEPAAPVKYRHSGLTSDAEGSLVRRLNKLMAQEKLFLDPELGLDLLAARLDASKHHVSQVINARMGCSFFDYINQLRVEEAQKLLIETRRRDLHVIEIAYKVGFNNKVSFNAAFKKTTGMTPTEFRKSHGQTDPAGEQPGETGAG